MSFRADVTLDATILALMRSFQPTFATGLLINPTEHGIKFSSEKPHVLQTHIYLPRSWCRQYRLIQSAEDGETLLMVKMALWLEILRLLSASRASKVPVIAQLSWTSDLDYLSIGSEELDCGIVGKIGTLSPIDLLDFRDAANAIIFKLIAKADWMSEFMAEIDPKAFEIFCISVDAAAGLLQVAVSHATGNYEASLASHRAIDFGFLD